MPCDAQPNTNWQRQRALDRLRKALGSGAASVVQTGNDVTFRGWTEKGDWCDGCAYRTLAAEGSVELRRAMARAQVMGNGTANRIRGMER